MISSTVIIPTAGLGSRLGDLGKFLNKSLLTYKHKPIIAHIIDQFPEDTKFIIPVGYKKEQVIDFCTLTYPEINFEFIEITHYTESFTGPGYTIKQCLESINSPFFYIPCDSYFTEELATSYAEDTCFVKQVSEDMAHHYTMCKIDQDRIIDYRFKETTEDSWSAFTGIMYVKDFESFKFRLKESESPEIIWTIQKNCKSEVLNSWIDFGNLAIYQAEVKKTQDYDFTKTDEVTYIVNNKVVKCWKDSAIPFKKHKKYLTNPKVYPENITYKGQFIAYDYCPGTTVYVKNDINSFNIMLEWLNEKVWIMQPNVDIKSDALSFYKDKTLKRIKQFIENNTLPTVTHINDVPVKDYNYYLNNINFELLSNDLLPAFTHGDLQFDNIIATHDNQFKIIDWRHEFGNSVEVGDLYYDLAKLYGGFVIDYGKIKKNIFGITKKDTKIYLDIPHCNNHELYITKLLEYIKNKGYNEYKVQLLVPIIFWNMSPLHSKPFDEFLWYLGILLFAKLELNETVC
jgi:NDP-sugar pyrophosphorylase family protein/thiamine kinase-like enzyme